MGFGTLRSIVRPLSKTLISCITSTSLKTSSAASTSLKSEFQSVYSSSVRTPALWVPLSSHFHSLTDSRFPKRRPVDKPRRKRASLKPPGPYAWVQYVPGEPILPNRPNEGSVKHRNEKKHMRQRRAFILSEKKKRQALLQEANRKKKMKQIERKMAAVARERAWAQRLAELQQHAEEKEKKNAVT